jgi:hypothetical protein
VEELESREKFWRALKHLLRFPVGFAILWVPESGLQTVSSPLHIYFFTVIDNGINLIRQCKISAIIFWTRVYNGSTVHNMRQTKEKWNFILWNEAIGFSLILGLSWLTELLRIPHYLYGEPFTTNWKRAFLRTVVILVIWGWVHTVTKRLLRRLHYLEEFIRMCSWCRKVCYEGEWIQMETYLNSNFSMRTTHGMCPQCLKEKVQEIQRANPSDRPLKP